MKPVSLPVLYEAIAERSSAITRAHSDWPCRRGCDHCCRSLPRAPELTSHEWEFLWSAYLELDRHTRSQVRARLRQLEIELERGASRVTCPFLARDSGACLVYARRPAACRMYGFYVARSGGQYCTQVQERVDAGLVDDVVWGNHDAVEGTLERAFGDRVTMLDWFEQHSD